MDFYVGMLELKTNGGDRLAAINRAWAHLDTFLETCEQLAVISVDELEAIRCVRLLLYGLVAQLHAHLFVAHAANGYAALC